MKFTVISAWEPSVYSQGGINLATFREPTIVKEEPVVTQIKNICEGINPSETDTAVLNKTLSKIYALATTK